MNIFEKIIEAYPQLNMQYEFGSENLNPFLNGQIILQNDSDDYGDYIKEWNIDLPLPDGLKVGKV